MATMGASEGLIFSCSDIARACRVKDFRVYIGEAIPPEIAFLLQTTPIPKSRRTCIRAAARLDNSMRREPRLVSIGFEGHGVTIKNCAVPEPFTQVVGAYTVFWRLAGLSIFAKRPQRVWRISCDGDDGETEGNGYGRRVLSDSRGLSIGSKCPPTQPSHS